MNYVIMCARLVKLNRLRGLYPSFLKPASNITWHNPNKTGRSSANLLDVMLYTVCMNVYQPFWQNCACLILLPPSRDKINSVKWKNPACFLFSTKNIQNVQLIRPDSTSVGLTQNDCRLIKSSQLSVFKDTMRFCFKVMYKNTNKPADASRRPLIFQPLI